MTSPLRNLFLPLINKLLDAKLSSWHKFGTYIRQECWSGPINFGQSRNLAVTERDIAPPTHLEHSEFRDQFLNPVLAQLKTRKQP